MKKLLLLFIFLCVVNLNAKTPKQIKQITFTEADCNITPGTLTWQDVNKKLNKIFNLSIEGYSQERTIINIPPFAATISGTITTIEENAFAWCTSLKSVDMQEVTTIEFMAFYYCTSLASVNMPLVKTIGYATFYDCSSLKSMNMPLVKTIESRTFTFCTKLENINIPLVSKIETSAFIGCTSLASITILNPTPPTLEEGVFEEVDNYDARVPNTCTLRVVDSNAVDRYKKDDSWSGQFLPRKILPVSP